MQTGKALRKPPSLMVEANRLFRRSVAPQIGGADPQQNGADPSSAQPPSNSGTDGAAPTARPGASHAVTSDAGGGDASALPSVSPEFQSELAALLAHYAALMGAARRSALPRDLAAALQAVANQQATAVRALQDRWHAASERQRAERPTKPAPNIRRKDDDTGLS